jgi:hypothetical protein
VKFKRISDKEIVVNDEKAIYAFFDKDIVVLSECPIKSFQVHFKTQQKDEK